MSNHRSRSINFDAVSLDQILSHIFSQAFRAEVLLTQFRVVSAQEHRSSVNLKKMPSNPILRRITTWSRRSNLYCMQSVKNVNEQEEESIQRARELITVIALYLN